MVLIQFTKFYSSLVGQQFHHQLHILHNCREPAGNLSGRPTSVTQSASCVAQLHTLYLKPPGRPPSDYAISPLCCITTQTLPEIFLVGQSWPPSCPCQSSVPSPTHSAHKSVEKAVMEEQLSAHSLQPP